MLRGRAKVALPAGHLPAPDGWLAEMANDDAQARTTFRQAHDIVEMAREHDRELEDQLLLLEQRDGVEHPRSDEWSGSLWVR